MTYEMEGARVRIPARDDGTGEGVSMTGPTIPITWGLLQDYEMYLQRRGCYAQSTIKAMVSRARRLPTSLGINEIPLDEDAAVALINTHCRSRSAADGYKVAARALIEYCRAEASV